MDTTLILGFFAITVGIPMVGVFWVATQKEKMKLRHRELAVLEGQGAEKVERLEARMRVLERIATDKGISLSDEIEQLNQREPALVRDMRAD